MKTKIRNIGLLVVALLFALSFIFTFAACGGDDEGKGGSTTGADYTITFDENYDEGSATKVGVYGGEFDMPTSPTREGYMFSGWYADSTCTLDADFDEISSDMTVYAGWIVREEGMVYVTYNYNLNGMGTYKVQEIEYNTTLTSADSSCRVSGYKFKGWYYDEECTDALSTRNRVEDDITLYALWYEENIFEAEYTDLSDPNDEDELRPFQGYSQNGDPIYSGNNSSNGFYIADMYINEAYIFFDIYAEEEVEVDLALRVALDFGWGNGWGYDDVVTITSDQYTLTVNGTKQSYPTMTMNGAANLGTGEITMWDTKSLCTVTLREGKNTIKFTVNNEVHGQGGTEAAIAPLVDYLAVYAPIGTVLTWDPILSNIPE